MDNGPISAITVYQIEQLLVGYFADSSSDKSHVCQCYYTLNATYQSITSESIIHSGFYISSCCERQHNGGNMTLFNINCNNQSRGFVHDCTYSVVMEYNTAPASGCTLQNELIIGCYEQSSCSNSGDLRLRDGNSTHEGRVELCSQGLWGRISDRYNSWNSRYAMVVCRQLGYPWECKFFKTCIFAWKI